jgi:hypothetical protein
MRRLPVPGKTPTTQGSKISPVSTDRGVAQPGAQPSSRTGTGENRTQSYTYFTRQPSPGESTPILYNGDRLWVKVKLTLETAGPVAVGQNSQLSPVLSGKGTLLQTNVEREFTIAKGTRLYIQATGVNRVSVTIEPLPWLEQIVGLIMSVADRLGLKK